MARIFHASFDLMTPAQLGETGMWASVGSGVVGTTGRTGDGITGTTGATDAQNTLQTNALEVHSPAAGYHGFAIKATSLPAAEQTLWSLLADDLSVQVTVTLHPSGTISVYRGTLAGGTLLGTSATVFVTSTFRYLEIGYTLTGDGRVEVRSIDASGTARQKVVSGGTSTRAWSRLELTLTDGLVLDDLYVNDVTSPATGPSYFSGDSTIEALVPIEVTFEQSWFDAFNFHVNTGANDAAGKIDMVDDDPLDLDATYLWTRRGFTSIRFRFNLGSPDDGRQLVDVNVVAVCRRVSSLLNPHFSTGMKTWYGSIGRHEFPLLPDTAYHALARMQMANGGLGGNSWTQDRFNASEFFVSS